MEILYWISSDPKQHENFLSDILHADASHAE